jgi:hypothetical protein
VHCGFQLTITAQQLGGRGRCPRCSGEIELPDLSDRESEDRPRPFAWMENSISALGSCVFHLILFLIAALLVTRPGGDGLAGEGEDVFIGNLPSTELSNQPLEPLSTETVEAKDQPQVAELETVTPVDASSDVLPATSVASALPSATGGGNFDLSASRVGGGGAAGFDGMVTQLRRTGLDIVICFDSTGSMGGEISEVKNQIKRIGNALVTMIPKTRISVCTYRDSTDMYTVMGKPLSDDIQSLATYLADIHAGGGGDLPEAVQEGMDWAVKNNEFKGQARKVMLIFGDAPPHPEDLKRCTEIASDFNSQQGGIVSTVTCRSANGAPLPEFVEIAQAGGGEAFLTSDERQIMTQLLVLVFGSKHRSKVIEAFKLLEE